MVINNITNNIRRLIRGVFCELFIMFKLEDLFGAVQGCCAGPCAGIMQVLCGARARNAFDKSSFRLNIVSTTVINQPTNAITYVADYWNGISPFPGFMGMGCFKGFRNIILRHTY